ncbi:hypothetical protein H0R92_03665 [Treponema sp. OMZ 840]|uniref:hypothetical protein n=1 Tax=Treponema sp. OMZ 840 TaxID=244313 RepID=UPI003D94142B
MIKKRRVILSVLFVFFVSFFAAADNTEVSEKSREGFFYVPNTGEMNFFIQSWSFLKKWEEEQVSVSDTQFANMYFNRIGKDFFASILYENFFRTTENESIKKQLKAYIENEKLETAYAKTVLKKLNSSAKVFEQDEKKRIQYSYEDKEFDENINLFDFVEVHPFEDEFGMLLFKNDWGVLTYTPEGAEKNEKRKDLFLMYGGGTNSLSIRIKEDENVLNEEDLEKIFMNDFFEKKYPNAWTFMEINKEGILENCGADHYFVGWGRGPDIIPEIDSGTFNAFLFNKTTQKVFSVSFFMNFSQINMNYEIRERLFDYLRFFTLFCFCD